jgi:hypothetical protein
MVGQDKIQKLEGRVAELKQAYQDAKDQGLEGEALLIEAEIRLSEEKLAAPEKFRW